MHDGFCEGMRYKTAFSKIKEGYAVPFTQGFASSANALRQSDTSMRRSDAIMAGTAAGGSKAMLVANLDVIVQLFSLMKRLRHYERWEPRSCFTS